MALQGSDANKPAQNAGGDNQNSMGQAFARAGGAKATDAAAPAHPTLNVGDGRNPSMNHNQSPAGSNFNWRNMGGGMRAMMARSPASEVLNKTSKALAKVYEENANKTFSYTLIPIDMNQTTNLSVSVLVLAVQDNQRASLGVAFHTLLLEGSAEAPQPKFENFNGKNVEIIRTVAEAYDKIMIGVVSEAVQKQFPGATIFNAEACVVPRDFNLEDEATLYLLASNAAFACSQELETRDPGFSDINLSNAENDSNLTVRTLFHQPQTMDAVGLPMRTDVIIDFQAAPINQNQQQTNLERTSSISRMGGFLDLVWDAAVTPTGFGGVQVQQGGNGWGSMQANYQRYTARFVATMLDSTQLLTIPSQLLALIPGLALRDGNAWVYALKGDPSANNDIHDIGAIGIEVNMENDASGFGKRIDTKSVTFKDESLMKLIALTFKPGLIMSMDVPECAPQTWYNSVFAAAAQGNQNAVNAIVQAANVLTNNRFTQYYDGGPVAIDENNRIHLGYYYDKGIKRDLRDIDYLAVLNIQGEKDPSVVKEWSDTFLRTEYPLAMRLSERARILRALVGDNVTFTGYASRVTFTGTFIDALASACRDAGLTMRASTNFADLRGYDRATGAHLNSVMLGAQGPQIFNRGGFGMGAPGMGSRGFAGRW